ncbi:MAG: tRNA 2-selenouridine(34) synthase MnmH [Pseudobdellovibrio sp.]
MSNDLLRELLLNKTPFIDVRAPIEFNQGHLPNAVNLPILNDEERALIGTTYKQQGNEAAVKLGYKLVSGDVKAMRVQAWVDFITKNPNTVLYCFRGGQRSQITQKWISEAGIERPIIKGGYKFARNFLIDEVVRFANNYSYLILSGTTGSGKTGFLKQTQDFYPSIDLEALANHRGSAFGAMSTPQPSQINFENTLALNLMQLEPRLTKPALLEDESLTIGRCAIPKIFFDKMRSSSVIFVQEPIEQRVKNIFKDYILDSAIGRKEVGALEVFAKYKNSVKAITRKLGGLRAQELLEILEKCEKEYTEQAKLTSNNEWIEKLLTYYYDPLYTSSLERRQVRIVFKGNTKDCAEYLRSQR